ncbi:MAG: YihY/virulence factor BrkB family protein [bacterium]
MIKKIKLAAKEFMKDNALTYSAALAFYTLLFITPLFIFILITLGIFIDTNFVSQTFLNYIGEFVGDQIKNVLEIILRNTQGYTINFNSIISFLILLAGATALINHLQTGLNNIWNIDHKTKSKRKKVKNYFKKRLVSLLIILVAVAIIIAFFIISIFLENISNAINLNPSLINLLIYIIMFFSMALFFAFLFNFMPNTNIKHKGMWKGAFFTSFLFLIGQGLIGIYLKYSNARGFSGIIGSLILFLLWIYYSSAVFYFGAEYTYISNKRIT